jgi:hypothetical protein
VADESLPFTPSSVAVFGEEEVAIGGEDNKVYIYSFGGSSFTRTAVVEGPRGQVKLILKQSPSFWIDA